MKQDREREEGGGEEELPSGGVPTVQSGHFPWANLTFLARRQESMTFGSAPFHPKRSDINTLHITHEPRSVSWSSLCWVPRQPQRALGVQTPKQRCFTCQELSAPESKSMAPSWASTCGLSPHSTTVATALPTQGAPQENQFGAPQSKLWETPSPTLQA